MNIKKRDPKEIKSFIKKIMKHSFGFEDLKNKFRVKKNKNIRSRLFQRPSIKEQSFKIYKNGFVYKPLKIENYEIVQKLLKKGLIIKEIKITTAKENKEIFEEFKSENLKVKEGYVLVKSKVDGIPLASGKYSTIPWVFKHLNVDEKTRIEIAKQMIKTITLLHNEGYVHGHPHLGNWVVNFSKNKINVRLIDFDEIKKATRSEIIKELSSKYSKNAISIDLSLVLKETEYFENDLKFHNFITNEVNKHRKWI